MRKTFLICLCCGGVIAFAVPCIGQKAKAQSSKGNSVLSIRVGVIFKNGDVKPLARKDFYLLSKNREEIRREVEVSMPPAESFDEYMNRKQNISDELRQFIKRKHIYDFGENLPAVCRSIAVDDIFSVPEFHSWLKDAPNPMTTDFFTGEPRRRFLYRPPQYPQLSGDETTDQEVLSQYKKSLSNYFPLGPDYCSSVDDWLQGLQILVRSKSYLNYAADSATAAKKRDQEAEKTTISWSANYVVASTKTSLNGEAQFIVPPGIYWLSNIVPSPVGLSEIFWNVKIILRAGENKYVELSNDNSANLQQISLEDD